MTIAAGEAQPAERVPLATLFFSFLEVSLCGFGGGLVWMRRMVVERRGWLDEHEFADIVSLCQFMPGPNIASIAVCVGSRLRGITGAVVGLAGFFTIPWMIGFTLGGIYLSYAEAGPLHNILRAVAAVAAGMMIGTGLKMLRPHGDRPLALVFAALAFVGLALARFPLVAVVLVLAPLSIAAAAFDATRQR